MRPDLLNGGGGIGGTSNMYNFSTTTLELVFLTIIVEDARAALGLGMILSDLAIVIQGGGGSYHHLSHESIHAKLQ